jgi:hypothetical protein
MSRIDRPLDLSPDEAPAYTPVSGLAVAALGVAILSVVLIGGLTLAGRMAGKPAFDPLWLVVPIIGLALGFIARRHVINSEGAYAGLSLAKAALWIAGLTGGSYAAYLFAIDLALRNQAAEFAQAWFAKAVQGPPEGTFLLTLDGPTRKGIDEKDIAGLRTRFSKELQTFNNVDINRIIGRANGKYHVEFRGVKEWSMIQGGYKVDLNLMLHTPEGKYEYVFPVFGRDTPELGGRTWHALLPHAKMTNAELTALGRLLFSMQVEGRKQLVQWSELINEGKLLDAYRETLPLADRAAATEASPGFAQFKNGSLLTLDGGDITPEARKSYAADLLRPYGINVNPGSAQARVGPPVVAFDRDAVRLDSVAEMVSPSTPTTVIHVFAEVVDEKLNAEIAKLRSSEQWRDAPTQAARGGEEEIERFPNRSYRIIKVDIRPNEPRLGQHGPGPGGQGGPGG